MAEGGKIYTKTIDSSYQDGVDNCLIIQPNYAYTRNFPFGSDWEEIQVGFFLSYTYSITDDNLSFPNSTSVYSGEATKDLFSYMGIIKDTGTPYLPELPGNTLNINEIFAGFSFNSIYNTNGMLVSNTNTLRRCIGPSWNKPGLYVSTSARTHLFGQVINTETIMNFDGMADTTDFAKFIHWRFKRINASSLDISDLTYSSSSGYGQITDVSLSNLKNLMDTNYSSGYNTLDGELPSGVNNPDSFFFYNAFQTVRPRIHAIAVKKIS